VSAIERLRAELVSGNKRQPLRALAGSGQLGYGIPEPALRAGFERRPHFIGCDMGSIDPGPAYLGSGRMATSRETTRRDLALVLRGARSLGVPLLLGTAGTAGAAPHLADTVALVKEIAREHGLAFRLATIAADMPRALVKQAVAARRVQAIGAMPPLTAEAVDGTSHLVGQMGTEAFARALDAGADVVIAGRACDTAIFAAIPLMLGYPAGPATHMAKIIECTSICCDPGGRDAMLGILEGESFVLESMNPARAATPVSVAAHALYEQEDPYTVQEPDGTLLLDDVRYEALDARRVRVSGARWRGRPSPTVKIEGAGPAGERAVLLCATVDPKVIAGLDTILPAVEATVASLLSPDRTPDWRLIVRRYGQGGAAITPQKRSDADEVFLLVECLAASADRAKAVVTTFKQYLLHHGFPGRLSTGGNIAFPFTPPELTAGTAYRFTAYHVMEVDDLPSLFPVSIEDIA
jgi:hypothetical protein